MENITSISVNSGTLYAETEPIFTNEVLEAKPLNDEHRCKEELISELHRLRQRNQDLEASNSRYRNIDEQFKLLGKKIAWGERQFDNLLNLMPVGVSICTDLFCHKIRHNPSAAQFLRISDWDIMSFAAGAPPAVKIFRAGKALSNEELPIQRSIWFGETVPYEEYEFVWEDGLRKVCTANSTPIQDNSGAIIGAISVLVDITEKKSRESLESFTDCFYILDDHWHFTYISSKAESHVEMSPEELLGKSIWEGVPPYVSTPVYKNFHEVAVNRKSVIFETLNPDTNRWYEVTVKPGEPGIYVIFREITERKLAEKELQKSRQVTVDLLESIALERKRFNDILQLLPVYLVLLTPDYHVSFANRFFEERFGESNGRRCFEYLFGRSEPCEICETYEVLKTMSLHEWECIGPDGRNYHIYDFPFNDVNGSTLIMEMGIDITELKIKEEALQAEIEEHNRTENYLRQSDEKFSKAFHGIPIMMALVTQDRGEYLDVNKAWALGTGYTHEEVIGHTTEEINFWANDEKWPDYLRVLKEHEKIENHEIQFCTKAGEIRWGLIWSQIVFFGDKKCQLTAQIDITEKKRTEQEMQRLDRLNLIGEMAASIGHEIRNPMTAVRGFIQLLNEQEYYEKDKVYFDLMIEELDRANGIISEYLGMARDKIVDLQPEYLDQVVKTIKPMLDADANHREMSIKLDLGRPPMPLIDQKEIRQVILNLARNGLEAMSPGGTLTIGTTVEGNDIVLFVKDEGHGLDPNILDKLGTPFITTKDNGTGLGLAVCYSIADRHNARIDFETGPEGTTFYVCFPMPVE